MSENLATILSRSAEENGDRVALRLDDAEVSFEQLEEGSARVAALLKDKGIEEGDRVATMLPNVPYFALVYYGALRMGAVVVPINPLYEPGEVAYHLGDSESKLLFAWKDLGDAAGEGAEEADVEMVEVEQGAFEETLAEHEPDHDVLDREADDVGVILYTSGTTGDPKGSVLTHGNLQKSTDVVTSLVDMTKDDVILGVLPFFHVFGQACGLNGAVKLGACLTLIPKFDPEKVLEVMQRDGVTIFEGVPTMYSGVLGVDDLDSYEFPSLRLAISGGQAMPVDTMNRFEDAFGVEVLEGYGLSETTAVGTFNFPGERKQGSIGKVVEGVEVKFFDDDDNEVEQGEIGEIAIKGPNVMDRYWNKEEETAEELRDGWFYTGDLGHIDEDGFVFIDDRKKDMIIRGGENVYPREIEEVLFALDSIEEAAVIGIEDERLGEEVAAAVVLKEGEDVSAEDIQEHVKGQLARYKYPRKVFFLDELPKGPTGKILKREIEVPEEA